MKRINGWVFAVFCICFLWTSALTAATYSQIVHFRQDQAGTTTVDCTNNTSNVAAVAELASVCAASSLRMQSFDGTGGTSNWPGKAHDQIYSTSGNELDIVTAITGGVISTDPFVRFLFDDTLQDGAAVESVAIGYGSGTAGYVSIADSAHTGIGSGISLNIGAAGKFQVDQNGNPVSVGPSSKYKNPTSTLGTCAGTGDIGKMQYYTKTNVNTFCFCVQTAAATFGWKEIGVAGVGNCS